MSLPNNRGVDLWLPLREAWVVHLRRYEPLTALVSVKSIYGEEPTDTEPKWPFIRIGLPDTAPYYATGQSGSSHRLITHAFAKGKFTDAISKIAAEVVNALDAFATEEFDMTDRQWVRTNLIQERGEASAYHAVIEMSIVAVRPTSG